MPAITIKTEKRLDTAVLSLPSHTECCLTSHEEQTDLKHVAADHDARLLSEFVFSGTQNAQQPGRRVWLQGDACRDGNFYSAQAVALSGINLEPVVVDGQKMGVVYQDQHARICRLTGLVPVDKTRSRTEQAREVFELAKKSLEENGFSFSDTVRTWIYLDHLLEWYDDFNAVRTAFFNENDVFEKMVPASTGIGAANSQGAAMIMDVLAMQPLDDKLTIQSVVSPLQNPALDYKSSFSRAVELAYPTHRSLLISGTASIDPDGKTVHLDDPEKQIRLTMEVVRQILKSRGMSWRDLFRGIAYFKNMDWLPIYRTIAEEMSIPNFPLAVSHADVCRHDLLFEIEVDAVKIV